MCAAYSNADFPFGSARFANPKEIARAGLYDYDPDAVFIGFDEDRPLFYSGMGGVLICAGARSGKLKDVLSYNLCTGVCRSTCLILDPKGELAAISQDQTADQKFRVTWNPHLNHGLPGNKINPVDFLRKGSPTLVSDTKSYISNAMPPSGGSGGVFFEGRAREMVEGMCVTLVEIYGVLTLPDLYEAINLLIIGGELWLDFAFEMSQCGFPIAQRIEAEIAAAREDSSGGFKGILGEITRAFACLSDPVLLESVSPPYDFSFSQLCETGQAWQVYLMVPAEFIEPWAPVLKAMFVAGRVYKSRAPASPRQTWFLDEIALLNRFPLAAQLFTFGAGIGIRPVAVVQSLKQLKSIAPDGENIIPSSAAVRILFGVRDDDTALNLSRMLGSETLAYIDPLHHAQAMNAQKKAAQQLIQGRDPFRAAMEMARHARMAKVPMLKQRQLLTPDEVLGMPEDRMLIFADGLSHPVLGTRKAYFDQPFMAGRFHPNPYHPPADRVRVRTGHGHAWLRVVTEPVPHQFAHYPQYRQGTWSKIR